MAGEVAVAVDADAVEDSRGKGAEYCYWIFFVVIFTFPPVANYFSWGFMCLYFLFQRADGIIHYPAKVCVMAYGSYSPILASKRGWRGKSGF